MRKVTTAFALLLLITSAAQATIIAEGGYWPADQNSWPTSWCIYVGYGGEDGTITATDETMETKWLFMGHDAGVEGTLNLNNTTWTVLDRDSDPLGMRVGGSGTAFLNLTNGSTLNCNLGRIATNSGSAGTATISGSVWNITTRENGGEGGLLRIGEQGIGNLTINQGGVVNNVEGIIGYTSLGTGVVMVDGVGSEWNNSSNLQVGWNNSGTLTIQNNATVTNVAGYIGSNTNTAVGSVTVSGGSRWDNSDALMVGNKGEGSLLIEGGSVATAAYGRIGRESTGVGDVTVTGEGSQWLMQWSLMVGQFGTGTLEISDGGLVSVGSTLTIDNNDTGESFLYMSTGGMLALYDSGNTMSGSLNDFLTNGVLGDSEALMFWDDDESGWMPMSTADPSDYTLQHITEGFGEGYTVLMVGGEPVPEPSTVVLLLSMIAGWFYFHKR